jgi:hypothetical protein
MKRNTYSEALHIHVTLFLEVSLSLYLPSHPLYLIDSLELINMWCIHLMHPYKLEIVTTLYTKQ